LTNGFGERLLNGQLPCEAVARGHVAGRRRAECAGHAEHVARRGRGGEACVGVLPVAIAVAARTVAVLGEQDRRVEALGDRDTLVVHVAHFEARTLHAGALARRQPAHFPDCRAGRRPLQQRAAGHGAVRMGGEQVGADAAQQQQGQYAHEVMSLHGRSFARKRNHGCAWVSGPGLSGPKNGCTTTRFIRSTMACATGRSPSSPPETITWTQRERSPQPGSVASRYAKPP